MFATTVFRLRSSVALALTAAVLALTAAAARADVKLPALVSSGMILQRGGPVNIWGWAADGEAVTVSFRGKTAQGTAKDGKFNVQIDPGEAGGPFELTVAGKNTLALKDVWVGDIWVCGGQSNMEWTIAADSKEDKDIAAADAPDVKLRLFKVAKSPKARPVDDVTGSWTGAEPKTTIGFSAVGYFFGRHLRAKMPEVPIGLIYSNWGGTNAETWTSREALASVPQYKALLDGFDKQVEAFEKDPAAAEKAAQNTPAKPGKKAASANPAAANRPACLFNGMIHPLLNHKIKGAIWYQGESNAGAAWAYRTLFPLMIKSWRDAWGCGDFPFYFVQLAPFQAIAKEPGESNWAELREAQGHTEATVKNTGMAVILDVGHETDIHPTPKKPVGERLALLALKHAYGQDVVWSGPRLAKCEIAGGKAVITFDHANGGLVGHEFEASDTRKNKAGQPTGSAWRVKAGSDTKKINGFAVCGADRKWHWAEAAITGDNQVTVSCKDVAEPVAVRYGWSQHPMGNLFNKAGLPANAFRTDDFPGITQPKPAPAAPAVGGNALPKPEARSPKARID